MGRRSGIQGYRNIYGLVYGFEVELAAEFGPAYANPATATMGLDNITVLLHQV